MMFLHSRYSIFIKYVSCVVLGVFILNTVIQDHAYAAYSVDPYYFNQNEQGYRYSPVYSISDISLPSYMGEIGNTSFMDDPVPEDRSEPLSFLDAVFKNIEDSTPISDKLVIHIQDAHCNYDAQMRIAEILEYIAEKYGIDHVNLEGGTGKYDLSVYRDIENENVRKKVADLFARDGELSGAEFLAATNPGEIVLNGVEDAELYKKNLLAYKETVKEKDRIEKKLDFLEAQVKKLKLHVYNDRLKECDAELGLYKDNKKTL